jgi:preprotein translocase subunit SecE
MSLNQIYKRGQGTPTRLGSGLGLFVIVLIGCVVLYQHLAEQSILVQTLVPVGVCVVLSWLIFWLMNKPTVADFLITSEGEIKKVSWSSRREIVVSTTVVICVVILMAVGLAVIDLLFNWIFGDLVGLY